MILYYCPDLTIRSAGMRILYRHVEVLNQHHLPAAIVHHTPGFVQADLPRVPIRYLFTPNSIGPGDILVIPEGFMPIMDLFKYNPFRRVVIALNWRYIYVSLPDGLDWRAFNIERVLTHSPFIGDFVSWAMRLPSHVIQWAVNDRLYYDSPSERMAQVTFITRKQGQLAELKRVLASRNPKFLTQLRWLGLDGLSEESYAAEIRRSTLFLNMSEAEGLPCSLLEAMRAGTLVAGFNSVGGQRELVGAGDLQNCILAENLDYVGLAQRLEPLLEDILGQQMSGWDRIRANASQLSWQFTKVREEASIVATWREILAQ